MPKLESEFKRNLVKDIEQRFPGSICIHPDPVEFQGFPDIIVFYKDRWAALEGKRYSTASKRPNQPYLVKLLDSMSFARFIYPENKESVLDEMERAFSAKR